jgi:hypothetical protein
MNCEKGDLARIVHIHDCMQQVTDRFVVCAELFILDGEPAWRLEQRVMFIAAGNFVSRGIPFVKGDAIWFDRIFDRCLRPIRNPGDDAVDEVLRKVGHPLSESHRSITAPKPQKEFT